MNKPGYIIKFLLVVLFFAACTARIDINTDDSPPRLIIYGYLTSDTTYHYVQISRSSPYFSSGWPEGITGAEVIISSEDTTYVLTDVPGDPGLYSTGYGAYGIEGKHYILRVKVDSDGDGIEEVYQATAKMPEGVRLDTITLKNSTTISKQLEVLFWGRAPESAGNYYNFRISRNYGPVNDSLRKFRMLEDKYIGKQDIEGFPCYYLSYDDQDNILYYGDMITLQVDVYPQEFGEFLKHAQREVQGNIPIFSGPPATLESNIKLVEGKADHEPLGFFSAYPVSAASTFFDPELVFGK